jgi:probable rRNA maturation factor
VSISIDVQIASKSTDIPDRKKIVAWVQTCLDSMKENAELTIRIVDEPEITELNRRWRGIDNATNVLSFPAGENVVVPNLLGDIVICAPVVEKEAVEQQKNSDAHWAHMVIHGILHLLDYDHENNKDAQIMESIEIEKLAILDYPNPYS